jgi:hypothetical protein
LLDAYGKWSLIDSYVMVLMMVAFRFHFNLPATGGGTVMLLVDDRSVPTAPGPARLAAALTNLLAVAASTSSDTSNGFGSGYGNGSMPDGASPGAIDVIVEPGLGFHTFLIGIIFSLVLSHIVLAMHRRTTPYLCQLGSLRNAVSLRRESMMRLGSILRYRLHSQWLILTSLLGSFGLVCYGALATSFAFDFGGLAGLALELLGGNAHQPFSLISLGTSLPHSAQNPDGPVRWLQIAFFVFALILPLARLLMLALLWVLPLRPRAQMRLFIVAEICNAWAALEVFVLSIVAALTEIWQFAIFIVGDRCDFLTPIIKEYFDSILGGDDTCFDVVASLERGCWFLFTAAIVSHLLSSFVMASCANALWAGAYLEEGMVRKGKRAWYDSLFVFISWCYQPEHIA